MLKAAVNPEMTTFTKKNETIAMKSAFEMGKQSKLFIPKGPFADIVTNMRIDDIVPSQKTAHYKTSVSQKQNHIFEVLCGFCKVLQHFTFLEYTKQCTMDKKRFSNENGKT